MQVDKAVIPAAGFGTRFLPVTKSQPKEMMPVLDKPTIQYVVEEAVEAGIDSLSPAAGRNRSNATSTSPSNLNRNCRPRGNTTG